MRICGRILDIIYIVDYPHRRTHRPQVRRLLRAINPLNLYGTSIFGLGAFIRPLPQPPVPEILSGAKCLSPPPTRSLHSLELQARSSDFYPREIRFSRM
jgi:hypothetical protein